MEWADQSKRACRGAAVRKIKRLKNSEDFIGEEITFLGCGFNKAKYAGKMKYCIEHGLDFQIYRLGARRIKNMIRRKFGIELEIEGKDLHTITKEAQEIVYI